MACDDLSFLTRGLVWGIVDMTHSLLLHPRAGQKGEGPKRLGVELTDEDGEHVSEKGRLTTRCCLDLQGAGLIDAVCMM